MDSGNLSSSHLGSGRPNVTHEISQYVYEVARHLVKARILKKLHSLRDAPPQYWQTKPRAGNPTHRALFPTSKLALMFARDYFVPEAIDHEKLWRHINLVDFCRCLQGPLGTPKHAFRKGTWMLAGLEVGCAEFERVYKGQGIYLPSYQHANGCVHENNCMCISMLTFVHGHVSINRPDKGRRRRERSCASSDC